MIKVFIDNNVAIDALRPNPDFEIGAKRVFQLIWQDKITPYMCANSLADIFYVLRKVQGVEKAKKTIANLYNRDQHFAADGGVGVSGFVVSYEHGAVRPALWLNL